MRIAPDGGSTTTYTPCSPPVDPTIPSPTGPGLHPPSANYQSGPNHFKIGLEGPDPNLAVGGTQEQQETQRDATIHLAYEAFKSYLSGHTPLVPRDPSDAQVRSMLTQLNPNPPIGQDGKDVTHVIYQSHIPNATPDQAYQHFVDQPGAVFGAGGMEIRPATQHLQDGGRYMLEIGGPVPTWLPVQINLNPAQHQIAIQTLDGHVLRGTQTFTFTNDGCGGSTLTQDARFQASSQLPGSLQQITSIADGQHEAWQYAHREIYEYFNGNPNYQGMGTHAINSQQLQTWGEALKNFALHPDTSADAAIRATGTLANWGIDQTGEAFGGAMDWLHIPGGGAVRQGAEDLGDGTEWVMDKAGDAAKTVIHDANPLNWF